MKKLKLLMLGACLLLILSASCISNAADVEYYVDVDTGDNADSGLTEALAFATIQFALDTAPVSGVNGDYTRINVKNTSVYVIQATLDIDTNTPTNRQPIIVQGYTTTIGDGGIAIIDGDDGGTDAVNILNIDKNWYIWADLEMRDPTGDIIPESVGDANYFIRVAMINAGDDCRAGGGGNDSFRYFMVECGNCTGSIFDAEDSDGERMYYSYLHDCPGQSDYPNRMSFINNIVDTTGQNRFDFWATGGASTILGNTFYNSTDDNVLIDNNGFGTAFINNIMQTAANENLDIDGDVFVKGYNNLNGNGGTASTGRAFVDLGGGQTEAGLSTTTFAPPAALDDLGFPTYYDALTGGSTVVGHIEPGAIPYEEAGGGGGSVTVGYSFAN